MVTHGQALLMLCHSADAHFTVLTSSKAWGEVDKHGKVTGKGRTGKVTQISFVLSHRATLCFKNDYLFYRQFSAILAHLRT